MLEAAATYAGSKLIELFEEKFKGGVIERCTKYRATFFYQSFLEAVAEEIRLGNESVTVDEKLEAILRDEEKSEVLFDAYRKVVFSASKELGPKIIGHLTARLVLESRKANNEEEKVAQAAEIMNDNDLHDFFKEYSRVESSSSSESNGNAKKLGDEIIATAQSDNKSYAGEEQSVSTPDLEQHFGGWALKLNSIGLLKDCSSEVNQLSEVTDAWTGNKTLTSSARVTRVRFTSGCKILAKLIERSYGAASS